MAGDERTAAFVAPFLQPDERLVWAGRPRPGLRLTPVDAVAIPLGLLWLVVGLLMLWGVAMVPVAAIGFYLAFGRLPMDAWLRRRSVYAVTDQRVLIVTGARLRHSLPLASVRSVRVGERSGTVEFLTAGLAMPHWLKLQGWPTSRGFAVAFERVEEPGAVARIEKRSPTCS